MSHAALTCSYFVFFFVVGWWGNIYLYDNEGGLKKMESILQVIFSIRHWKRLDIDDGQ